MFIATQLNSTSSGVELSCVAINGPLRWPSLMRDAPSDGDDSIPAGLLLCVELSDDQIVGRMNRIVKISMASTASCYYSTLNVSETTQDRHVITTDH